MPDYEIQATKVTKKDKYSIIAILIIWSLAMFVLVSVFSNNYPKTVADSPTVIHLQKETINPTVEEEKTIIQKDEHDKIIVYDDNEIKTAGRDQLEEKKDIKDKSEEEFEKESKPKVDTEPELKTKENSNKQKNSNISNSKAMESNYNMQLIHQVTEKDGSKTWTNSKVVDEGAKIYGGTPSDDICEIKLKDGSTAYTNLSMPFLD